MEDLMWWLTRAVFVGGGIAGAGLALLYTLQEKLIYVPRFPGLPNTYTVSPDRYGLKYEDVHLKARDGTQLHAWFMYPEQWKRNIIRRRPTVLFFQENAGNMSMRLPFLRMLARTLECSIFAPSYRGYGQSQGSPSEAGLKQDADAALEHLLQRRDVNPRKIVVLGKSLGAAVGIYIAANNRDKFAAAVFENTFTSITDVAPKVLPFLKYLVGPGRHANFLIRNKWDNLGSIGRLHGLPMLLMSSQLDELLPPAMMRQLYVAAAAKGSDSVVWVEFSTAGHMDAYEVEAQVYWPALMQFFKQQNLGPGHWGHDEDEDDDDDELAEQSAGAAAVKEAVQRGPDAPVQVAGVQAEHSDLRRRS